MALATISVWFIASRGARERREAAYRASLANFQHDLPLGMRRINVEKFLVSRKIDYQRPSGDIWIPVGNDSGLVCPPTVYVMLQFNLLPQQVGPSPLDNLGSISLGRASEDCL